MTRTSNLEQFDELVMGEVYVCTLVYSGIIIIIAATVISFIAIYSSDLLLRTLSFVVLSLNCYCSWLFYVLVKNEMTAH